MGSINLFLILVIAVPGCLCLDIKYKRELNYDSHSLYFLDEYRAHEPRYQRSGNIVSEFNKIFAQSSRRPVAVKKNFVDMFGPHLGEEAMKIHLISATQTITQCLRGCPVTSDYRPVCGTNGVTYHNLASLLCARTCSVVVDVMRQGQCFSTTTTFTTTTTTTTEANQLSVDSKSKCIQSCAVTPEDNPICGTDGVTYRNFQHLICVVKCGTVVHALRYGKCSESTVQGVMSAESVTTTTKTFTNEPNSIAQCLQNCPVTLELQPVCGSDGVTYANSGRLICAKFCGIGVLYKHQGNCLSPVPAKSEYDQISFPSSERKPPSTNLDGRVADRENADQCLRNCQISSSFYPVCGTNGVTYTNVGQLLCASSCGFHVRIKYKGVCADVASTIPTTATTTSFRHSEESETVTQCMNNCPVTSEYNPVCGSDAVTYGNFGKLICARSCGVGVKLMSKGGCRRS